MAKINATYGAGYHIDPNFNYSQLEEAQRKERRKKQLQGGAQDVFRQTFAAPFNLICAHCGGRTARGTHQYVNRKKSGQKYLGMPIWELEFRCQHCQKYFSIVTDWETPKLTGGYVCDKHCRRPDGDDFYARNLANAAATAALKAAKADEERSGTGDLDALAQHNERMERIHAVNRDIEERLRARETLEAVDEGSESLGENTFLLGGTTATERTAGMSNLSRTLLKGIRQKRERETDLVDAPNLVDRPQDDNDGVDDEFDAFQAMLRASVVDGRGAELGDGVAGCSTAYGTDTHDHDAAPVVGEHAAVDADSPSEGAARLDDTPLAANPFEFVSGAAPDTVPRSDGVSTPAGGSSALLTRQSSKKKSSSLLSKFQS